MSGFRPVEWRAVSVLLLASIQDILHWDGVSGRTSSRGSTCPRRTLLYRFVHRTGVSGSTWVFPGVPQFWLVQGCDADTRSRGRETATKNARVFLVRSYRSFRQSIVSLTAKSRRCGPDGETTRNTQIGSTQQLHPPAASLQA